MRRGPGTEGTEDGGGRWRISPHPPLAQHGPTHGGPCSRRPVASLPLGDCGGNEAQSCPTASFSGLPPPEETQGFTVRDVNGNTNATVTKRKSRRPHGWRRSFPTSGDGGSRPRSRAPQAHPHSVFLEESAWGLDRPPEDPTTALFPALKGSPAKMEVREKAETSRASNATPG